MVREPSRPPDAWTREALEHVGPDHRPGPEPSPGPKVGLVGEEDGERGLPTLAQEDAFLVTVPIQEKVSSSSKAVSLGIVGTRPLL